MLKNLKMRGKLVLGFGVVILILIGLSGYSFLEQATINRHLDDIINTHFASLSLIDDIDAANGQLSRNVSDYVLTSATSEIETYAQSIQSDIESIQTSLSKLQAINANTEIQKQLNSLIASFDTWRALYREEVGLKNAKKQKELLQSYASQGKAAFGDFTQNIRSFADMNKKLATQAYQNAFGRQKTATLITIILNVLGIAFSIFFAFVISENIVRPVQRLATYLEKVSAGDLRDIHIVDDRKDEIGALNRTFETFLNRFKGQISEINAMVMHLAASANEMSATSAQ